MTGKFEKKRLIKLLLVIWNVPPSILPLLSFIFLLYLKSCVNFGWWERIFTQDCYGGWVPEVCIYSTNSFSDSLLPSWMPLTLKTFQPWGFITWWKASESSVIGNWLNPYPLANMSSSSILLSLSLILSLPLLAPLSLGIFQTFFTKFLPILLTFFFVIRLCLIMYRGHHTPNIQLLLLLHYKHARRPTHNHIAYA